MLSLYRVALAALAIVLATASPIYAAEEVGKAVLIRTSVTGASGPLAVRAPVHRDERIRTSQNGLGQFLFRDGTKLAVGWGSSVVIDKFIFDDSNSVKKLTVKAAKGTFRWISGNSNSSAYEIVTPAGTIGVRGTAFDFYVGSNGVTAVVLLNGSATFCGSNGCRQLKRKCDCVIATRAGGVTNPRRVTQAMLKTMGSARALPFLSGDQALTGGFAGRSGTCGLSTASLKQRNPERNISPQRAPGRARATTPDKPNKSNNPDRPNQPSNQGEPDKPDNRASTSHNSDRSLGDAPRP